MPPRERPAADGRWNYERSHKQVGGVGSIDSLGRSGITFLVCGPLLGNAMERLEPRLKISITLKRQKRPVLRWPGQQALGIIDQLFDGAVGAYLCTTVKHNIYLRRLAAVDCGKPAVAIEAGRVPLDALGNRGVGGQNRPARRLKRRLQWMG